MKEFRSKKPQIIKLVIKENVCNDFKKIFILKQSLKQTTNSKRISMSYKRNSQVECGRYMYCKKNWDCESRSQLLFKGKSVHISSFICAPKIDCSNSIKPSILSNILSRTKNKVSLLQIRQIFCLTCFHEVYISQKVKIDRRNEQGVGANKTMNLCIGICLLHN